MLKGKVKFYNRSKEFGFISAEDGQDYYFNAASLLSPDEGDEVVFSVQDSSRGLMAKKVKCVSGAIQMPAGVQSAPKRASRRLWVIGGIIVFVLGLVLGKWLGIG